MYVMCLNRLCCCVIVDFLCFFFFKQKTAYEMRISDWSSDVCSSDLFIFAPAANAASAKMKPVVSLTPEKNCAEMIVASRSEERRVGKECVSTCRSRWSPYP